LKINRIVALKLLVSALLFVAVAVPAVSFLSTMEHDVAGEILKLLDTAQGYVWMTSYSLDHQGVVGRLNGLFLAGIEVKVMIDSASSARTILSKPLFEVTVDSSSGLMHAKLLIIDGRTAVFGTGNFTQSGLLGDSNTFLVFNGCDHVQILQEFVQAILEGGSVASKKTGNTTYVMTPSESGRQMLLENVLGARKEIRFLSYAFTDTELLALLKYKSATGVSVRGVVDRWNEDYSPVAQYLQTGLQVRFPSDNLRIHDKTIVIDRKIVITGSANHSFNAWQKNREVVAIIESAELAEKYLAHFSYLWEVADYDYTNGACTDQYDSRRFREEYSKGM